VTTNTLIAVTKKADACCNTHTHKRCRYEKRYARNAIFVTKMSLDQSLVSERETDCKGLQRPSTSSKALVAFTGFVDFTDLVASHKAFASSRPSCSKFKALIILSPAMVDEV
jgi:hypothetical protein